MILSMTKPSSRRLTDPDIVSARLRGHMGERKITRTVLSNASGISQSSLGKKLDKQTPFTYDEMDRVLEALGLSWKWLVDGVDDQLPSYPLSGAGGSFVQSSHYTLPTRHEASFCRPKRSLFTTSRNLTQASRSGKLSCSEPIITDSWDAGELAVAIA